MVGKFGFGKSLLRVLINQASFPPDFLFVSLELCFYRTSKISEKVIKDKILKKKG